MELPKADPAPEIRTIEATPNPNMVMYDTNEAGLPLITELKAITWEMDCERLFHYQCHEIRTEKLRINQTYALLRKEQQLFLKNPDEVDDLISNQEYEYLFRIERGTEDEEQFQIVVNDEENNRRNGYLYLVVKSLKEDDFVKERGYPLEPGDYVRFGRIEYKINQMQKHDMTGELAIFADHKTKGGVKKGPYIHITDAKLTIKNDESIQCKYCMMSDISEEEFENLLITPCNCKGSERHVHFKCLKDWINKKVKNTPKVNVLDINFTELNCELCRTQWPSKVKCGEKTVELISIERPKEPFLQLEQLGSEEPQAKLTVLKYQENRDLTVGNQKGLNLEINDLSVDPMHAKITYTQEDGFRLFDLEAKFGTLIRLRVNYDVPRLREAIQIGRTAMTVFKKPDLSAMPVKKNTTE